MVTQLTGENLPQWISDVTAAELPGLSSFAKGLEQDLDALTQGLTSNWNSGPVEGRVNHKMLRTSQTRPPGTRVLLTA
jgi:transposase